MGKRGCGGLGLVMGVDLHRGGKRRRGREEDTHTCARAYTLLHNSHAEHAHTRLTWLSISPLNRYTPSVIGCFRVINRFYLVEYIPTDRYTAPPGAASDRVTATLVTVCDRASSHVRRMRRVCQSV